MFTYGVRGMEWLEELGYELIEEDTPMSESEGDCRYTCGHCRIIAIKHGKRTIIDEWEYI